MGCLASAKYDCTAIILKQIGSTETTADGTPVYTQDPISGAIVRDWTRDISADTGIQEIKIRCQVRGFVNSGIRILGTQEKYRNEGYIKEDMVQLTLGKDVHLTDGDRVTEIRGRDGKLIWREEERELLSSGEWQEVATIFDVKGVTPVMAPFVGHTENFAVLERAEVQ